MNLGLRSFTSPVLWEPLAVPARVWPGFFCMQSGFTTRANALSLVNTGKFPEIALTNAFLGLRGEVPCWVNKGVVVVGHWWPRGWRWCKATGMRLDEDHVTDQLPLLASSHGSSLFPAWAGISLSASNSTPFWAPHLQQWIPLYSVPLPTVHPQHPQCVDADWSSLPCYKWSIASAERVSEWLSTSHAASTTSSMNRQVRVKCASKSGLSIMKGLGNTDLQNSEYWALLEMSGWQPLNCIIYWTSVLVCLFDFTIVYIFSGRKGSAGVFCGWRDMIASKPKRVWVTRSFPNGWSSAWTNLFFLLMLRTKTGCWPS